MAIFCCLVDNYKSKKPMCPTDVGLYYVEANDSKEAKKTVLARVGYGSSDVCWKLKKEDIHYKAIKKLLEDNDCIYVDNTGCYLPKYKDYDNLCGETLLLWEKNIPDSWYLRRKMRNR